MHKVDGKRGAARGDRLAWRSVRVLAAVWLASLGLLGAAGVALAGDGDLDPSFGAGGRVTTHIKFSETARSVVIQPDGKLVIAGHTGENVDGVGWFVLARYNADGSLDPTFGSSGVVTTDIGGADAANALALQPDGKLVLGGTTNGGGTGRDFALARYNADGSLDSAFGGGMVVTDFAGGNDAVDALALQPDGKIVAGGDSYPSFAVARYHPDGTLDTTFGAAGTGKVTVAFPPFLADGNALALQPDGKVVIAGFMQHNFGVARLNANGTLDTSFSGDGKVSTNVDGPDNANAVLVQPDGRVVVAGFARPGGGSPLFALLRYNSDGSLDATFGAGGVVKTAIGAASEINALLLLDGGKLLAAGYTNGGSNKQFALARFHPTGALDTTFGTGGSVTTDMGGSDEAFGLLRQPDGRLVAVGGTARDIVLARYWNAPSLDPGGGGVVAPGVTPELGSFALFGSGALGLAGYAWSRWRRFEAGSPRG